MKVNNQLVKVLSLMDRYLTSQSAFIDGSLSSQCFHWWIVTYSCKKERRNKI